MNIPPQSKFFYKGKWSPLVDNILVDTIIRLKNMTGWTLMEFPSYFLLTAAKEIHTKTAQVFTKVELTDRVGTLHVRYRTFKALVAEHGVQWDIPTRFVSAEDWVWKQLCKVGMTHIMYTTYVLNAYNYLCRFSTCLHFVCRKTA